METVVTTLTTLSFLIPILAAIPLYRMNGRAAGALLAAAASATLVASVAAAVIYVMYDLDVIHAVFARSPVIGEVYGVLIDPMSVSIGSVVAVAGFFFLIYSIEYVGPRNREHPVEKGRGVFYAWMLLFTGATLGFVYSPSFFQMAILFELMTLACWGVVSYYKTGEAFRAGLKAFIVTHVGALAGLYTVIAVLAASVGDTSLYALHMVDERTKLLLFTLVLIAGITKSAQFPVYSWLVDAMVAPTPASAYLHGAAMIEMGVYLVSRFVQFSYPLPPTTFYVIVAIASASLIIAAVHYPLTRDAKRFLAYSTIGESAIMYMCVSFACLGYIDGLRAMAYHMIDHAFAKGLAFLSVGVLSYALGTKNFDELSGVYSSLPITTACFATALFGLSGLPPINYTKFYVFFAGAEAAAVNPFAVLGLAVILVESTVFFIVSLYWLHKAFFSGVKRSRIKIPLVLEVPMLFLLILLFLTELVSPITVSKIWWGC